MKLTELNKVADGMREALFEYHEDYDEETAPDQWDFIILPRVGNTRMLIDYDYEHDDHIKVAIEFSLGEKCKIVHLLEKDQRGDEVGFYRFTIHPYLENWTEGIASLIDTQIAIRRQCEADSRSSE